MVNRCGARAVHRRRCLGYSALIKAAHPFEFLNAVFQYRILSPRLATLVAAALPFVELILGIALLAGVHQLGASVAAALLFLVFMSAQASALLRGIDADCGCFGTAERVGLPSLLCTSALLAGAVVCVVWSGAAHLNLRRASRMTAFA